VTAPTKLLKNEPLYHSRQNGIEYSDRKLTFLSGERLGEILRKVSRM